GGQLEIVRREHIVRIQPYEQRRLGVAHPCVSRGGRASAVDAEHRGSFALERRDNLTRMQICRAIVDDDDLGSRTCLPLHAVERLAQGAAEIVAGYDSGDWQAVHAPVRLSHQPYIVRSGPVTRQLMDVRSAAASAVALLSAACRFATCAECA